MNTMFKRLYKYKTLLARLLLIVTLSLTFAGFTAVFAPEIVYASDPDDEGTTWTDDDIFDAIGGKNLGFNAYIASMWLTIKQNLIPDNLTESLKFTDLEISTANLIWGHLAIIGVSFAVIYLIMDLNRAAFMAASNWTMQSLISPLLKFGACMFVIQYGADFVSRILGFGNWFIDTVAQDVEAQAAGLTDAEIEVFKDMNLGAAIAFLLGCMIFWLVSMVVSVIFLYKAVVWKIEVVIRAGVTPVILGDVWEGKNSGAVRWLKKLAGCVMYGGAFLLVMKVGSDLSADNFAGLGDAEDLVETGGLLLNCFGALAGMLVIPIAEIGALSIAKQACMEVWQ